MTCLRKRQNITGSPSSLPDVSKLHSTALSSHIAGSDAARDSKAYRGAWVPEVDHRETQTGHSPFLSQPEETVGYVV